LWRAINSCTDEGCWGVQPQERLGKTTPDWTISLGDLVVEGNLSHGVMINGVDRLLAFWEQAAIRQLAGSCNLKNRGNSFLLLGEICRATHLAIPDPVIKLKT
jgi:hypothetical protein